MQEIEKQRVQTVSYACNSNELDAFSGTQGHSTIQFDNRNQMPRLSRFLFGSWLKPSNIKFNIVSGIISKMVK